MSMKGIPSLTKFCKPLPGLVAREVVVVLLFFIFQDQQRVRELCSTVANGGSQQGETEA